MLLLLRQRLRQRLLLGQWLLLLLGQRLLLRQRLGQRLLLLLRQRLGQLLLLGQRLLLLLGQRLRQRLLLGQRLLWLLWQLLRLHRGHRGDNHLLASILHGQLHRRLVSNQWWLHIVSHLCKHLLALLRVSSTVLIHLWLDIVSCRLVWV